MAFYALIFLFFLPLGISQDVVPANFPDCANNCLSNFTNGTFTGNCPTADVACLCAETSFQDGWACCVNTNCGESDERSAIGAMKSQCPNSKDIGECSNGRNPGTGFGRWGNRFGGGPFRGGGWNGGWNGGWSGDRTGRNGEESGVQSPTSTPNAVTVTESLVTIVNPVTVTVDNPLTVSAPPLSTPTIPTTTLPSDTLLPVATAVSPSPILNIAAESGPAKPMTDGQKAGVAIAVFVAVALIAAGIYFFVRWRKRAIDKEFEKLKEQHEPKSRPLTVYPRTDTTVVGGVGAYRDIFDKPAVGG
ncbi:hypothetical protein VTL71DRAFT_14988 [Oculimacula yallundae]|uniref:CFEM domain-containing protein n=1 Tax=Oculimacula yallundae TaxID=86028 RepID=A0ABR4CFB3_9HELO